LLQTFVAIELPKRISVTLGTLIRSRKGFGILPSLAAPRVLCAWTRRSSEHLVHAYQAIEQAIQSLGFPGEMRPFTPRVTLGKIRRRLPKEVRRLVGTSLSQLSVPEELLVLVTGVSLILSSLTSHGARYNRLHLALLNPGA